MKVEGPNMPAPRFRPRLRLRTMMALVALAAIGSFAERTRRQRDPYKRQAAYHAKQEQFQRRSLAQFQYNAPMLQMTNDHYFILFDTSRRNGLPESTQEVQRRRVEVSRRQLLRNQELIFLARRAADRHAMLRKKYERAARYPWLPVEPDPPGN